MKASTTTIILGVTTAAFGIGLIVVSYKLYVVNTTLEAIYAANPNLKPADQKAAA
jgi:hypothetical protein